MESSNIGHSEIHLFWGQTFGLTTDSFHLSRKHLRTKVTPDFHVTFNKIWGNLGSESK